MVPHHHQHSFLEKSHTYKFALFTPQDNRKTTAFLEGFNRHLQQHHQLQYEVDTYYLADYETLQKRLEENRYDALVCIDEKCALRAKELLLTMESETPLIFSSITDVNTDASEPLLRMTGLSTPLAEYANQMSLVLSYFPNLKTILILQDQTDSAMKIVGASLPAVLQEQGYTVSTHAKQPTLTRQDILDIASHDMVILLSQRSHEHYTQRLSLLCKEHKTVLYISDTTSVRHGAALGFGKDDNIMGYHAASTAYHILATKTIPEVVTVSYSLKLNLLALEEQGLQLVTLAPLLSLINAARVITPSTQDKISAYLRLEQIPLE